MKLKLEKVDCRYGAPMGRPNILPATNAKIKLHLEKMPMVDGDYDSGYCYWGKVKGLDMYVAWVEQVRIYVKTASREDAKAKVRELLPAATFYR